VLLSAFSLRLRAFPTLRSVIGRPHTLAPEPNPVIAFRHSVPCGVEMIV
jgi:hypothetical protein